MKSTAEILGGGVALDELDDLEEGSVDIQGQEDVVSPEEEAWLEKRRGKITGSNFHLLMGSLTKAKFDELQKKLETAIVPPDEVLNDQGHRRGKAYSAWVAEHEGKNICKQSDVDGWQKRIDSATDISNMGIQYLRRVVAEAMGSSYSFTSASVRWGREFEPEAIRAYESITGYQVDSAPFRFFEASRAHGVFGDMVGSTPDGLVMSAAKGVAGALEVKCPKDPAFHMATVISGEIPSEGSHNYVHQCDAHMLVTDSRWCDFVSFDPRMPESEPSRIVIIRRERCEEAMANLVRRLEIAADWVTRTIGGVRSRQAMQQFAKLKNQLTNEDRKELLRALDDIPF